MPDATKTPQNRIDAVVSLRQDNTPLVVGASFQTITGGEVTRAEDIRDREPGSQFDSPIPGTATVTDITVTRTWKADRDGPLYKRIASKVNLADGSCGRIIRDINGNRADLHTYRVLLIGVTGPEGDTNGNGKGMLTLTFACDGAPV